MDRRVRPARRVELDSLDRRRPVREPYRIAEPLARRLAVAGVALDDLLQVGGVLRLVVGVVELLLIHAEPDRRPLLARRRRLREGGAGYRGERGGCGKDASPVDIAHEPLPLVCAYFLQLSRICRVNSASAALVCAAFFALSAPLSQRANTARTCVSDATCLR